MKLIVSTTAFCIAFIVSIYNNLLLTSIKRSVFAFIIFFIVAAVLEKVLEPEVQAFQSYQEQTDENEQNENNENNDEKNDDNNDENNLQAENSQSDEKQQSEKTGEDANEFEPIDFSKMAEKQLDVDGMDPKLLANLLNNFSDDSKSL